MTGLRESKKRAVRRALYDAAIRLFEEKGYEAVSVSEIVQAAGVAKGTFFNHFPSKADILADWYAGIVERSLDMRGLSESAALADRLIGLTGEIGRVAAETPELWRAKNEQVVSTASIQAVERESDAALVEALTRIFDEAAADGELPAGTGTRELADLVLAVATGTWREAMVTGQVDTAPARLRERLEFLCKMASAGLAKDRPVA